MRNPTRVAVMLALGVLGNERRPPPLDLVMRPTDPPMPPPEPPTPKVQVIRTSDGEPTATVAVDDDEPEILVLDERPVEFQRLRRAVGFDHATLKQAGSLARAPAAPLGFKKDRRRAERAATRRDIARRGRR